MNATTRPLPPYLPVDNLMEVDPSNHPIEINKETQHKSFKNVLATPYPQANSPNLIPTSHIEAMMAEQNESKKRLAAQITYIQWITIPLISQRRKWQGYINHGRTL